MKSTDVTIISAPFGFGPTGKSLAIAKELISRGYSVKILGDENTSKIVQASGILAYEYQYRTELNLADLYSKLVISYLDISTKIINPGNAPLIFGDSLFWLRGRFERSYDYPAILTLSQRFFQEPLPSEIEKTKEFHEVDAILAPSFLKDLPPKKRSLVFYSGGLRSPYLGDKYGKAYFNWCTKVILTAANRANWEPSELYFLVPPQICDDSLKNKLEQAGITVLCKVTDTSPYLMEATHAFISPGIETTLETLASGINPLFTPAFNGSHIPQLIADRKNNIGLELSKTFNLGAKKFENGTDNLSALSKQVEEYTAAMLNDEKILEEAIVSATEYLSNPQKAPERFPLGKNGAKEIAAYAERYLNLESIKSPYYRVSVKAKIKIDNKTLLVRESNKAWDLPGGGVEHDETIEKALKRELKEETGITDFSIINGPICFKMIDKSANRPLLFLVFEISAKLPEETPQEVENHLFEKDAITSLDIASYSEEYANFIKN